MLADSSFCTLASLPARPGRGGDAMGDASSSSSSSSASYVRMVQHLIEQCLVFHMSQEECVEALWKHANIKPVITSTVWKELEKENQEFFASYAKEMRDRALEKEAIQVLRKLLKELSPSLPHE
ncbi:uncharacterized protein LOC144715830 [Wolffia australiana]